jgi:hypothetical protein
MIHRWSPWVGANFNEIEPFPTEAGEFARRNADNRATRCRPSVGRYRSVATGRSLQVGITGRSLQVGITSRPLQVGRYRSADTANSAAIFGYTFNKGATIMARTKCAGSGCQCSIVEGAGTEFCDEACRRNTADMAGPCPCGHPACTEKPPTEIS